MGTRLGVFLEGAAFDLRYGARVLGRQPGFSLVAVLTLASAIAFATTVFSVVDGTLLRPLPYPAPESLVRVYERVPWDGRLADRPGIHRADFLALSAPNAALDGIALYHNATFTLLGVGEPDSLRAARVSANLFQLLGVTPVAGRAFSQGDAEDGEPVAMISYRLWQTRFGGSSAVLARSVRLDEGRVTIVGVLPPYFDFPWENTSLWVPLRMPDLNWDRSVTAVARLRRGVTPAQGQSTVNALLGLGRAPKSEPGEGRELRLQPLVEFTAGKYRTTAFILLAASGILVLLVCVNLGNLLLARAMTNRGEFAVRSALGARASDLARQLLSESLLLSLLAGGLGIALSWLGVELVRKLRPPALPLLDKISLNAEVLAAAWALALATGVLFGLAPLRRVLRFAVGQELKGWADSHCGGPAHRRSLAWLVIAEITLAMLLLAAAGLFAKSLARLHRVPLGFDADHLLVGRISLPRIRYPDQAHRYAFCNRLVEELRSLPGADAAALVTSLPLGTGRGAVAVSFEENPPGLAESDNRIPGFGTPPGTFAANAVAVSPTYFQTMGIPILAGRSFDERDTESSPRVVLISETMGRHLWRGESPVGKRVWLGRETWEIAGVVGDSRYASLEMDYLPTLYRPLSRASILWIHFIVRSGMNPSDLGASVRGRIRALDSELPVLDLMAMDGHYAKQLAPMRFYVLVFGAFATLAMVLAAAGIYSVVAYSVSRRSREIGTRCALGAQSSDILRLVMGQAMVPALAGVGAGAAAGYAATRFLSSLLFEVEPADPVVFTGVALLLLAVAGAACYMPARRACRVDPAIALRSE